MLPTSGGDGDRRRDAAHVAARWSPAASARGSSAPTRGSSATEAQRRAQPAGRVRRLRALAGAARRAGRALVVTYKDCEAAFAGIPGVEVAHFNAIAGLDAYRDVRLLIVIGRPLPRDSRPRHRSRGAFFRHAAGRRLRARRCAACACATAPAGRCRSRAHADAAGRGAAGGDLRRRADPGDRPRPRGQPHRRQSAGGACARRRRAAAGARPGALLGDRSRRTSCSACCSRAWPSTARAMRRCCIPQLFASEKQAKKAFERGRI